MTQHFVVSSPCDSYETADAFVGYPQLAILTCFFGRHSFSVCAHNEKNLTLAQRIRMPRDEYINAYVDEDLYFSIILIFMSKYL